MSVSEREQAEPVHRERRMTITGFACGIMSLAAMCACGHRHKAKNTEVPVDVVSYRQIGCLC
ncbi:MAG: hypothetical protein PUB98_06890 [Clostridiales bacterium]|nr:hypothetical protein [Clostridiales bacterium]